MHLLALQVYSLLDVLCEKTDVVQVELKVSAPGQHHWIRELCDSEAAYGLRLQTCRACLRYALEQHDIFSEQLICLPGGLCVVGKHVTAPVLAPSCCSMKTMKRNRLWIGIAACAEIRMHLHGLIVRVACTGATPFLFSCPGFCTPVTVLGKVDKVYAHLLSGALAPCPVPAAGGFSP